MTPKQAQYRKNLLCKIHTHQMYKQIHANGAWEDFLIFNFNESSSKFLSIKELVRVIALLDGSIEYGKQSPDFYGRNMLGSTQSTKKQLNAIIKLANLLGYSDKKLILFIRHQTGEFLLYTSYLHKLSKKQATSIITGLRAILKTKDKA